jgi:hypothetical protein
VAQKRDGQEKALACAAGRATVRLASFGTQPLDRVAKRFMPEALEIAVVAPRSLLPRVERLWLRDLGAAA